MDYARKAARIQVSLPPELLKEIDDYAKDNYCTRSGIICLATSQYMNAQRMGKAMEKLYKLLEKIAAEKGTPEDYAQLDKIHDILRFMRPDMTF